MFKFSYKRKWLWHTYKVTGFKASPEVDRMSIYFEDGSMLEIAQWSKCDCKLGNDYFMLLHKKMESEAGVAIPLKNVAK
jgi:hypothetical protein